MRPAILAVLLAAALTSGCNVFAPFFTEADDPLLLIEDARHARAAGDPARAVALLEKALQKDPTSATVQVELSATLLQRDRLTLLELERVTSHLLETLTGTALPPAAAHADAPPEGRSLTCTFPPGSIAEPMDPRAPDHARIAAGAATLRRVAALLADPEAPPGTTALPPALTRLDACSIVRDGAFRYDRAGVLATVRTRLGSPERTTAALAMHALTRTLGAYLELFEQPDLPVYWFVVNGAEAGACVAETDYDRFTARARTEIGRIGQALLSLDQLAAHTGQSDYDALVRDALAVYERLRAEDLDPCTTD